MNKLYLLLPVFMFAGCTDQGPPINYSIENTSHSDLTLIIFDSRGQIDTLDIQKTEIKVISTAVPPYDDGPFGGKDSLKVIFTDKKELTYYALDSKNDCLDSDKNPFCEYSHYFCSNSNCIFTIDDIEYLKAK